MSRKIKIANSHSYTDMERKNNSTDAGKLIITDYREKQIAMILKNNSLISALFPEQSKIGAIYIGKVKKKVSNINACFVEIEKEEIGFLPLKDAQYPYLINRKYDGRIMEGDELLVQVKRDAQKTKQASLSAHISLSNPYFALTVGSPFTGYSGKFTLEQKAQLKRTLEELKIIENGMLSHNHLSDLTDIPVGLIVRTRSYELKEDSECLSEAFLSLVRQFKDIISHSSYSVPFVCLKEPSESFMDQILTNQDSNSYEEVLTDHKEWYSGILKYVSENNIPKAVRLYEDNKYPLKLLYNLESKLQEAISERVWLKSGGYLIIQPTEALTAVDVNSGKYDKKNADEEDMAYQTNIEAAIEIAHQLILRNLSGIIIVDFINMRLSEHNIELMNTLKKMVSQDKVPTKIVDMTPLGLVEITRKKLYKPLHEQLYHC